jgi:hypothetical protein
MPKGNPTTKSTSTITPEFQRDSSLATRLARYLAYLREDWRQVTFGSMLVATGIGGLMVLGGLLL